MLLIVVTPFSWQPVGIFLPYTSLDLCPVETDVLAVSFFFFFFSIRRMIDTHEVRTAVLADRKCKQWDCLMGVTFPWSLSVRSNL